MSYKPKDYIEVEDLVFHVRSQDLSHREYTTGDLKDAVRWFDLKVKKWIAKDE